MLFIATSVCAAITSASTTFAAEVKVLADSPLRVPLNRIAADFRADTSHSVVIEFGSAPSLKAKLAAGEKADVLISLANDIDDMARQGKLGAVEAKLAQIKLGLAVRAGVTPPDISTLERFKKALEKADTVVHTNVASGRAFLQQLEKIGFAKELKGKLVEVGVPPGVLPEIMKRSGYDIGVGQMSQIIEFSAKGIASAGPVPGAVQVEITYSAGVLPEAVSGEAARLFVKYLGSPKAAAALVAAGAK